MGDNLYSLARGGKLKLKGELKHSKKQKRKKPDSDEQSTDEDAQLHGGWWRIGKFSELLSVGSSIGTGHVSINMLQANLEQRYLCSLPNGTVVLGEPHQPGSEPRPEEALTVVRIDDSKVALKTGFGKYVGLTPSGELVARADAVGPREYWEPVFQEGKAALCGSNGLFLTFLDDESIACKSQTAGSHEFLCFRSHGSRAGKQARLETDCASSSSSGTGLISNFVDGAKRFQSYGSRELRPEERRDIRHAHRDGRLHEALLDQREKIKSDKFCK